MKKRNIVISFLLLMTMLMTACGTGKNPFVGDWTGRLDVTRQFEEGVKARYPELAEFVEFEDLVFEFDVIFTDGEMRMLVRDDSIDEFFSQFENDMEKMSRKIILADIDAMGMTLEEVVAESGMTEEDYMETRLNEMNIHQMTNNMKEVTETSMEAISDVSGTYTFNETSVNLRYSDGEYEAIDYLFKGKQLILTIKGENYSLDIVCEK